MAAIVRHGVLKLRLLTQNQIGARCYATKAEKKRGIDRRPTPKIEFTAQSLASKGFLRSQKEYTPPKDVTAQLDAIIKSELGDIKELNNASKKFKLFNACYVKFQHSVPNSLLHTIETVQDLVEFYNTPVDTKTPFDKIKCMDLPPNLHVQQDYVRYHPDTDTKFGGQTAFPRSSTLVTGLKYKEKYAGHEQAQTWPYNS